MSIIGVEDLSVGVELFLMVRFEIGVMLFEILLFLVVSFCVRVMFWDVGLGYFW